MRIANISGDVHSAVVGATLGSRPLGPIVRPVHELFMGGPVGDLKSALADRAGLEADQFVAETVAH